MSATVALYVYDESMDDEVLSSIGVHGFVGQLSSNVDMEDEIELLDNTEKYTVGETKYEFPRRVQSEINGVQEVDTVFYKTIEAVVEELAEENTGRYDSNELLEWLDSHRGDKIFNVAL